MDANGEGSLRRKQTVLKTKIIIFLFQFWTPHGLTAQHLSKVSLMKPAVAHSKAQRLSALSKVHTQMAQVTGKDLNGWGDTFTKLTQSTPESQNKTHIIQKRW